MPSKRAIRASASRTALTTRRYTSRHVRGARMTVAAVVLAANPASALADADGTPGARRIANAAWAGGATPVVVCSFDPEGDVGRALVNAEVTLVEPVAPELGPVAQIANGIDAAASL